jgi:universal stress protein E
VIKTADGLSASGRLFGSVAKSLMRTCPCPVWVLKPEKHGQFDCVVAAIDVEAADEKHKGLNRNILELALSIAQREDAKLHIVAAWDLWMEKSIRRRSGEAEIDAELASHETKVRQAVDQLLQAPNSIDNSIEVHIVHGTPARMIRSVVEQVEADLLVMGTVCRTNVAGFLIGNTAESVVGDIDCSLLALKPEGFVTAIDNEGPVVHAWKKNVTLL